MILTALLIVFLELVSVLLKAAVMSVHRPYQLAPPIPVVPPDRFCQSMSGSPTYSMDPRLTMPYPPMMNEPLPYPRGGLDPDYFAGPGAHNNCHPNSPYSPESYAAGCEYDPYHPVPGPGLVEQIRRYSTTTCL